jgi:hypothetical protein
MAVYNKPKLKANKRTINRDWCFRLIDDHINAGYTGKLEVNITQGTVVNIRKEEFIKA